MHMMKNGQGNILKSITTFLKNTREVHAARFRTKAELRHLSFYGLIETITLFALIEALCLLFDISPGEVVPHPYWIPVILLSVQYGTFNALVAAITAITLVLFSGLSVQATGEDYYHYLARVSLEPALWLCVATFLGEVRMRHIMENRRIVGELSKMKKERKVIADYCRQLTEHIEELEHKLVVQNNLQRGVDTVSRPEEPVKAA